MAARGNAKNCTWIDASRKGMGDIRWEVGDEAAHRLHKYEWKYTMYGKKDRIGIPYCSHPDLVKPGAASRPLSQAVLQTDNKVSRVDPTKNDCSPGNLVEGGKIVQREDSSRDHHSSNGEIHCEQVKIWRVRRGRKILGHGRTKQEALTNALEERL